MVYGKTKRFHTNLASRLPDVASASFVTFFHCRQLVSSDERRDHVTLIFVVKAILITVSCIDIDHCQLTCTKVPLPEPEVKKEVKTEHSSLD